jgi:hypothetical protein
MILVFASLGLRGQQPPAVPPVPGQDIEARLPNGKSQREEILKLDHKKNLEDAAAMAKLAGEVSEDLEKDDRFVVSLKTLKKLDDIEKLAKNIRGRLKKY